MNQTAKSRQPQFPCRAAVIPSLPASSPGASHGGCLNDMHVPGRADFTLQTARESGHQSCWDLPPPPEVSREPAWLDLSQGAGVHVQPGQEGPVYREDLTSRCQEGEQKSEHRETPRQHVAERAAHGAGEVEARQTAGSPR